MKWIKFKNSENQRIFFIITWHILSWFFSFSKLQKPAAKKKKKAVVSSDDDDDIIDDDDDSDFDM